MYVVERINHHRHQVAIKPVLEEDYMVLTKSRFYFNWKLEKGNDVYKLVLDDEILGVMSFLQIENEDRLEISLLAVSKENRGKHKKYDRIAGNLIAFACRQAIQSYAIEGCVSLVPKTSLKRHYADLYGMVDAGRQLFLQGIPLLNMLKEYEL
jgi:hypothetical protein